jgi:hypothetical protein
MKIRKSFGKNMKISSRSIKNNRNKAKKGLDLRQENRRIDSMQRKFLPKIGIIFF